MYEYPDYNIHAICRGIQRMARRKVSGSDRDIARRIKEAAGEVVGGMWLSRILNMRMVNRLVRQC